jgi:drug/metabolite transporter (DMT)-like permease
VRGIVSIVLNVAIVRYYDMGLDYKYDVNFKNILKRNVIVVIHGLAITAAQFYLPLPIVHTINFFAPIFIFIIDYFENGVRINKTQFYFLLFSVLGLLCTINNELMSKLIDKNYELKTEFKNYIKLTPGEFSLYGLALIAIMFLWAYGLLRVRTFYKNNHTYVNFHLGLLFTITSGFLYPYQVHHKTDLYTLFISVFMVGLPLALGQLVFVAGLGLNKKTGQIVILTGLPVFVGYLISYFRYGEMIQSMELLGSTMILVGLMGVIRCGDEPESTSLASNKLIGDPSKPPTEMLYNVLRLG